MRDLKKYLTTAVAALFLAGALLALVGFAPSVAAQSDRAADEVASCPEGAIGAPGDCREQIQVSGDDDVFVCLGTPVVAGEAPPADARASCSINGVSCRLEAGASIADGCFAAVADVTVLGCFADENLVGTRCVQRSARALPFTDDITNMPSPASGPFAVPDVQAADASAAETTNPADNDEADDEVAGITVTAASGQGTGGGLAVTGASSELLATAGLSLLIVGGAFVVTDRRRSR